MMKKQLTYLMIVMGIGAFAYLLALMSVGEVKSSQIISVLVMSGLIGWSAQVYEWKSLALRNRWLLHLVAVLALETLMLLVNGWFNGGALAWTSSLYALVFWGIRLVTGGRHA